jgi:hypothetical protein
MFLEVLVMVLYFDKQPVSGSRLSQSSAKLGGKSVITNLPQH